MKKIVAVISAIFILFSFVGCDSPFGVHNTPRGGSDTTGDIPTIVIPDGDFTYVSKNNIAVGPLVLVNYAYEFEPESVKGGLAAVVNTGYYQLKDNAQKLTPEALTMLNLMTRELVAAKGDAAKKSIITASYRDEAYQQGLINRNPSEAGTLIAYPRHSEHHTGYAIDLQVYIDGKMYSLGDYPQQFNWLYENMYKYGWVVRYAEDKKDITKIYNEPWHLRYVGVPHAQYMKSRNLCLEEYIEQIKSYAPTQPLVISGGAPTYYVYYVRAAGKTAATQIPVIKGYDYEISGNNVDGYIVTCWQAE